MNEVGATIATATTLLRTAALSCCACRLTHPRLFLSPPARAQVVGSDESSVNSAVAAFNARAVGSTDDTFAVSDPKNVAGGVGGSDSKQAKSAVAFGFTTGYVERALLLLLLLPCRRYAGPPHHYATAN